MVLNRNLNNYNQILRLRENITKSRLQIVEKIKLNMTSKPETDLNMNCQLISTSNSNYSIPYESVNDMNVEKIEFFHQMVQTIKKVMDRKKRLNGFAITDWREVKNEMTDRGFSGITVRQCSDCFYNCVYFYVKVFNN